MLTATNITKNYPGAPGVLGGIDLTVPDGQFLAIMGPSGSGKSTLLHILSGMEPPTGGSVHLDGRELTQLAERDLAALRLRHLGFVFQQPRMLQALSLRDNVALPGLLAGRVSRSRVAARADELMSAMGVARVASHLPSQVSGGQLQRASICRALINGARTLMGDEPTGALNRASAEQVLDGPPEVCGLGLRGGQTEGPGSVTPGRGPGIERCTFFLPSRSGEARNPADLLGI